MGGEWKITDSLSLKSNSSSYWVENVCHVINSKIVLGRVVNSDDNNWDSI